MRIGINIPDELHERLQPLKSTMNISEICREALEAHAKKYEENVGWLDSDSARQVAKETCEKEKQREALVEVDWESIGYQDAKDWVQAATLSDWDEWNRCRNHPNPLSQNTVWVHGRHVREGMTGGRFVSPGEARTFFERHRAYTERVYQQGNEFWEWMSEEYDGLGPVFDYGAAERDYGRGWMAFTTAAWEMICQLRKEYQQRWQRELVESRQSRPEPEIPEHILADIQRKA